MGYLELDELLRDLPHGKAQRVEGRLLHPLPCTAQGTERRTNTRLKKKEQRKAARQLYNLSVDKSSAIVFPIVEFTDIFKKKT